MWGNVKLFDWKKTGMGFMFQIGIGMGWNRDEVVEMGGSKNLFAHTCTVTI